MSQNPWEQEEYLEPSEEELENRGRNSQALLKSICKDPEIKEPVQCGEVKVKEQVLHNY